MVKSLTDKHGHTWEFYIDEDRKLRWRCKLDDDILRSAHKGFANMAVCRRNAELPGLTCVPSPNIPPNHYFDKDTKKNLLRSCEDKHGRIWQIFKTKDKKFGWRCRDADGNILLVSDGEYDLMVECLENARVPGMKRVRL